MTTQHPPTYWTSDRSALVEEGDPRAAFLAYAPGDPITPEHQALLHGKPVAPKADEAKTVPTAALPKPAPAKPRATGKRG